MSLVDDSRKRRAVILLLGFLSIPVAYLMDSLVKSPHPFYQAWAILSAALYVIISGIAYFVFLNVRINRRSFP